MFLAQNDLRSVILSYRMSILRPPHRFFAVINQFDVTRAIQKEGFWIRPAYTLKGRNNGFATFLHRQETIPSTVARKKWVTSV